MMPRRLMVMLVLSTLAAASAQHVRSQPSPSSWWTVIAAIEKPRVRSGEVLTVNAVLKNISAIPLIVVDTHPLRDFRITVKDNNGSAVPYTSETRALIERLKDGPVFRSDFVEVQPGKEMKTEFTLGELYGTLPPGKYTLQIERLGSLWVDSYFVLPKGLASAPVPFEVLQ